MAFKLNQKSPETLDKAENPCPCISLSSWRMSLQNVFTMVHFNRELLANILIHRATGILYMLFLIILSFEDTDKVCSVLKTV